MPQSELSDYLAHIQRKIFRLRQTTAVLLISISDVVLCAGLATLRGELKLYGYRFDDEIKDLGYDGDTPAGDAEETAAGVVAGGDKGDVEFEHNVMRASKGEHFSSTVSNSLYW